MKSISQSTEFIWFALLVLAVAVSARVYGEDAPANPPITAKHILIVTGAKSTQPELKAAELLSKRLQKRSSVAVAVQDESAAPTDADVTFVVGTTSGNVLSKKLVPQFGAVLPVLPNSETLHPEGFAVKSGTYDGKHYIVIAGTDGPGTIYGVGWMLRAMTYLPESVLVPVVDVTDKPALWMRGGNPHGAGSRAREFGKLRPQTPEESLETMEDQILLGTNVFGGNPVQLRETYGVYSSFGRTANQMDNGFVIPEEWRADGGRSRRYVCPSVPEARKALLESFDKFFRESPDYDIYTTNSGDEGGCRCDKCMPWGGTYIKLVHEIADILHKYHPNTKVLATNQDLTNEGNQAIFDYLNSEDSSWLYAIRYGPGADEMQTYIRGPVNPRWFEYEGFGPLGNYLKFMHHELPRTTNIALYSDITHWMQAQYAVPHPDIALAAVYDRRAWNARPRNFYKVGQEIFHYAVGDMHYSEGIHDDFNKWFWYRLMWNPHQTAEAITNEYCRYWFGPEAQDEMARAIFVMEETLDKPVLGNPGIAQAVVLLRSAGKKIPPNLLKDDWRWRVITEKALMDRYIQMELERGQDLKRQAGNVLSHALTAENPKPDFEKALNVLEQPLETGAMKALRDEATQRSEESNAAFGYREPVVFIVDQYDLTEVGWWKEHVQQALTTPDAAKLRNAANMILHYDDPGEGGYYDDVGWPMESKHLTFGHTLWTFEPFAGPAKMSQYNQAYSRDPNGRGVTFDYENLDPQAEYVVRISVGGQIGSRLPPGFKPREGIDADGTVISDGFDVPTDKIGYFEFDVPQELTRDGKVQIVVTGKSPGRAISALYEIWLMRKDKMPWTARM